MPSKKIRQPSGTYYPEGTDPKVIRIIESAMHDLSQRVRIFLGDTDHPGFKEIHGRDPIPGKSWHEENDVSGFIGRTMGPQHEPILLATKGSHGGSIIMCDCIVRILVNGVEKYRHSGYKDPEITTDDKGTDKIVKHLKHRVFIDGELHAQFEDPKKMKRYVEFMKGERMTQ